MSFFNRFVSSLLGMYDMATLLEVKPEALHPKVTKKKNTRNRLRVESRAENKDKKIEAALGLDGGCDVSCVDPALSSFVGPIQSFIRQRYSIGTAKKVREPFDPKKIVKAVFAAESADQIAIEAFDNESPAAVHVEQVKVKPKAETKPVSQYTYPQYKNYCQLSNQTREERFPKIFDSLIELQPDAKRILSFGCSTGEECFALAKRFPKAEIVGLDINHYSLTQARNKNKEKDRVFFTDEVGPTGKYDIITALMVLFGVNEPVPKPNWEQCIEKMDKHLAKDGLLIIYTSEFSFEDTEISRRYKVVRSWIREHNVNKKNYFCGYYRKVDDKEDMEEVKSNIEVAKAG